MAAHEESLAHRIARNLIHQHKLVVVDVWGQCKEDATDLTQQPDFTDELLMLVSNRIKRIKPAHLGVLIDQAEYSELSASCYLPDSDSLVAAVLSEIIVIMKSRPLDGKSSIR
jgi:hypothetical protein